VSSGLRPNCRLDFFLTFKLPAHFPCSKHIAVAGLALDYCVAYTCLDARRLGFETWLVLEACRPVDSSYGSDGSEACIHFLNITSKLERAGVHIVKTMNELPEDKFSRGG